MKGTFLLVAVVVLGLLGAPRPARAQFTYATNNSTITITRYTGSGGEVTIPGTLDGFPVTRIGNSAFAQTEVTRVMMPESVTAIEDWAFTRCYSLTELTLPDSLTRIAKGTFYLCTGLTNIAIPDSVNIIDDFAFAGCGNLTDVTLGNRIATIEDRAFSDCFKLTAIIIPDSVQRIGTKAFSSCYSLTNVTIGNGVRRIEESAFSHCYTLISVTFGKSLLEIEDWAFFLCAALKEVKFRGNAPSFLSSGLFAAADDAVIYYLPGAIGWGSTFDGIPTAPWLLPQPTILDFGPGFGVQTNAFSFMISWATNLAVVVEASTAVNSSAWSRIATNTLSGGSSYFSDPGWKEQPTRFYRLRTE